MKTDEKQLWISQPLPASNLFHVFDDSHRSLCGKFMIINWDNAKSDPVDFTERYAKGQDCKACFKKAKLTID